MPTPSTRTQDSDFTAMTPLDIGRCPRRTPKGARDYVWIFEFAPGTFDPGKFSPRGGINTRRWKRIAGRARGVRTVEVAFRFVAGAEPERRSACTRSYCYSEIFIPAGGRRSARRGPLYLFSDFVDGGLITNRKPRQAAGSTQTVDRRYKINATVGRRFFSACALFLRCLYLHTCPPFPERGEGHGVTARYDFFRTPKSIERCQTCLI